MALPTRACVLVLLPAAALLAAALLAAAPVSAYVFNEPHVRQIAPQTVPFDWSAQKCTDTDIPDQPARAFRDSTGTINFVDTHATALRNTTTDLTTLTHRCSPVVMSSGNNGDPSKFDDWEWLAATWTSDGTTVHALVHAEYQGWWWTPDRYCIKPGELFEDKAKCWFNALTLATSTNGGSTFSHAAPADHLVASIPHRYERGTGPVGFFQPSNIVRGQDGWHYVMAKVVGPSPQAPGTCVLRTRDLSDPTSWRGWSGSGFTVRFPSPYLSTLDPAQHVCRPANGTGTLSESLTWNTYFKKWMLVGSADDADFASGPGFYYFLSDDLINWQPAVNLMQGELPWTYSCGDPPFVRDPSLIDPASKSRNFDTVGQRPYLFFTRFNIKNCSQSLDRDLIRIPIEFSNQEPGGPSATIAASTTSARPGEPVTFDASGSRDADGAITKYEWDLDGDGTYEEDSGAAPVVTHTYEKSESVTVTVRVHDDDGKATDDTTVVEVRGTGTARGSGGAGEDPSGGAVGRTATGATTKAVGPVRVLGSRARMGGAVLRVRVPAAGVVRVRSRGARVIRAVRASASRAGIVRLRLRASRAGRAALADRDRVRARVLVMFIPVGGAMQSRTHTVTVAR